jgi:hypothetical protein
MGTHRGGRWSRPRCVGGSRHAKRLKSADGWCGFERYHVLGGGVGGSATASSRIVSPPHISGHRHQRQDAAIVESAASGSKPSAAPGPRRHGPGVHTPMRTRPACRSAAALDGLARGSPSSCRGTMTPAQRAHETPGSCPATATPTRSWTSSSCDRPIRCVEQQGPAVPVVASVEICRTAASRTLPDQEMETLDVEPTV